VCTTLPISLLQIPQEHVHIQVQDGQFISFGGNPDAPAVTVRVDTFPLAATPVARPQQLHQRHPEAVMSSMLLQQPSTRVLLHCCAAAVVYGLSSNACVCLFQLDHLSLVPVPAWYLSPRLSE
jgi:hypothetical protein